MKTPEEIKEGIELCIRMDGPCSECPYDKVSFNLQECSKALIEDAFAYILQLESLVPRWIPVKERLPKGEVLALNDRGTMHIGYIEYHTYGGVRMCMCEDYDSGIAMSGVTHWMPKPEPPAKGE